METVQDYVDAIMDFNSAEDRFIEELCSILKIKKHKIKRINLSKREDESNSINLILEIHLSGSVEIRGYDLALVDGVFKSPKTIEMKVGEIHL